jgi:2-polyprenyl-6-methoxyphenol hydroxylase-like FAD-dependent oxidoreductase
MGLDVLLAAQSAPVGRSVFLNRRGRRVRELDLSQLNSLHHDALVLNRADLHLTLYESVRDGLDLRFGLSVQALAQDADGVTVTLSDGRVERYDLLIGADGMHSAVRQLLCGTDGVRPFQIAYVAFLTPDKLGLEAANFQAIAPGIYASLGSFGQGTMGGLFAFPWSAGAALTARQCRLLLMERLPALGWRFAEALAQVPDEALFCDHMAQVVLPQWQFGRVALLGDAAYTLTLVSSNGASMAIIGAQALAEELLRQPGPAAFARYEARLRPQIMPIQRLAAQNARMMTPPHALAADLQSMLFRVLPERAILARFAKAAQAAS